MPRAHSLVASLCCLPWALLTRDHAKADALVQDCLERAISRWYLRAADPDLHAWLFTMLHNLSISGQRSLCRRPLHETLDEGVDAANTPADQEGILLGRDILSQFAVLSEDHRAVLLLVAIEGLPYGSIARILDILIDTVMSWLSRALERFRRQIDGERPALRRVK